MKETIDRLKYNAEITDLLSKGISLPSVLNTPFNIEAFRWIFDNENANNHLPVYLHRPLRFIQAREKNDLNTSGFALSCYDNESNAENIFNKYLKSNPNFWKIVGDSISKGTIKEPDGRITQTTSSGHFDLYEFVECNLNDTFAITKKLI